MALKRAATKSALKKVSQTAIAEKTAPRRAPKGEKPLVGWREWVSLPEFGTPLIKAKIDTGARTSSLHAFKVKRVTRNGKPFVEFYIHPQQRSAAGEVHCVAPLIEERRVTSSSGHAELRPVIGTDVVIGAHRFHVELTLANRSEMGFRMLVGRQALRGRFLVDPGRSYLAGGKPADAPKATRRKSFSAKGRSS